MAESGFFGALLVTYPFLFCHRKEIFAGKVFEHSINVGFTFGSDVIVRILRLVD